MSADVPGPQDNVADHEAARRGGRDVIAQVDQDAIAALLARLPTGELLQDLDAIIEALDAADAKRARKRAGILGRLLGRDLVAMARPDPVDSRVRVHLASAANHAVQLQSEVDRLAEASTRLQRHAAALREIIDRQGLASQASTSPLPDVADADDTEPRWLVHLAAIELSWRATIAQMTMATNYARLMLDRHGQVRDVLVPLWRQRFAAQAVGSKLRQDEASNIVQLHDSLRSQIVNLRESRRHLLTPTPSIAPAPKEPLP